LESFLIGEAVKNFLIKRMREEGLKLTSQRLAILDVLVERNLHPSVRTLYHGIEFLDGLFHAQ